MTKAEEIKGGCLSRCADDEPVFVLRATDKLAPTAVRYWAELAARHGVGLKKTHEAVQFARRMEDWAGEKKLPD
jgi:hypothetical protein